MLTGKATMSWTKDGCLKLLPLEKRRPFEDLIAVVYKVGQNTEVQVMRYVDFYKCCAENPSQRSGKGRKGKAIPATGRGGP
jgi:hypothetical protein